MKAAFELLRADRRTRVFFGAQIQSSFGTGAGYVAVLLIAYERFHSPWAITGVLLAEFLPAMFLGPFVGAAADRWSRKRLLVLADVVRAAAFAGIAVAGSFEATVAFALLAGGGNAIYNPTVMAALPNFTGRSRMAAATSLYHSVAEIGFSAGPAIAALAFVFVGAEALMVANALSFVISAAVLSLLSFNESPTTSQEMASRGLARGAWAGMKAVSGDAAVRSLLVVSGATVFTMGMINVGELLLAREALALGNSEFSMLVAAMGVGIAAGSLLGCAGGAVCTLKRNFLRGLCLCGAAAIAAGLAPSFGVALAAFAAMGIGNGAVLSYEGVLLQTLVPNHLLGRIFGVKNAVVSWCFAAAFSSAGALAVTIGPRALFVLAGAGTLAACSYGALRLRSVWTEPGSPASRPALVPAAAQATPA
jgi:MFS family permease